MAGEGIQQCQHHMQLLFSEQPFSPAAVTEREAELENMVTMRGEHPTRQLHLALGSIWSSKLCLHFHKVLSWLREKNSHITHRFKTIIYSFYPCTYFVIKLSADEMKHHSNYKCIFKTSLLSIISQ